MKDFITLKECDICSNKTLKKIFSLKKFPLTGIYLKKSQKLKTFDNDFMICENCNHGQLRKQINPKYLYQKTYTHRTSKSQLAININEDFYNKLKKIIKNKKFKCILEVGCNDLLLAKKIKKHTKKIIGVDPIWGNNERNIDKKISIFGGFINDENLINKINKKTLKNKIDLVISSHTFEHTDTIKKSLQKILKIVDDKCLFIIETPSLDSIIRNGHFDQIFHQHQHYVSERSIVELCKRLKCQLIGFKYNYQIWGGNVMYIFKKNLNKKSKKINKIKKKIDLNYVKEKYKKFQIDCREKITFLKKQHKNVIAFGAAQMMPILAYHSKSNFSFLKALYDDNPQRIGKYLPNIKPKITKTNTSKLKNSFVIITANEMCRPIIGKISKFNPLRIITWFSDF